jgi:glycosyltransferase involved in cell wall biosynthesis
MSAPDVAVPIATYNRLPLLKNAVASAQRACGSLSHEVTVVDGGSDDGTREWLAEQSGLHVIQQELPLTGAVIALNLGFAHAVNLGARFVVVGMNDDSEFLHDSGVHEIERAVEILEGDEALGGVAFEMDTRRAGWVCEQWAGIPYGNTCLVRLEVGMAIARAQGDPEGRAWWDRTHLTYASDTEFGLWLHKLGWLMHRGVGLHLHDCTQQDDMKRNNFLAYVRSGTAEVFRQRWGTADKCQYSHEAAEKFGGRIR